MDDHGPYCLHPAVDKSYLPCDRLRGHDGPCRHRLDVSAEPVPTVEQKDDAGARKSTMRRFLLIRDEDVHNTSGTGTVAEGVEFSNGQVALHWLSQLESVAVYGNAKVLGQLHGHHGKTNVIWLDQE